MKKLIGLAVLLILIFSSVSSFAGDVKKDDIKNNDGVSNDKGSNNEKSGSSDKGKKWIIYW